MTEKPEKYCCLCCKVQFTERVPAIKHFKSQSHLDISKQTEEELRMALSEKIDKIKQQQDEKTLDQTRY